MIQAKRLGHVVLNVRNAEKSRDFYTQTLGLKIAHENLERGAVFLSFGKEHHDLALFQQATGEPPAKTQPGLHHVAWRLDTFEELQAAYKELKRMGIPIDGTAEHNVTRSVYFFDPDGVCLEFACWTKVFDASDVAHDPVTADGTKAEGLITGAKPTLVPAE